jgi:uncharacterized protein YukE
MAFDNPTRAHHTESFDPFVLISVDANGKPDDAMSQDDLRSKMSGVDYESIAAKATTWYKVSGTLDTLFGDLSAALTHVQQGWLDDSSSDAKTKLAALRDTAQSLSGNAREMSVGLTTISEALKTAKQSNGGAVGGIATKTVAPPATPTGGGAGGGGQVPSPQPQTVPDPDANAKGAWLRLLGSISDGLGQWPQSIETDIPPVGPTQSYDPRGVTPPGGCRRPAATAVRELAGRPGESARSRSRRSRSPG